MSFKTLSNIIFLFLICLFSACESIKPRVIIDVHPATAIKIGGRISLTCRVSGPTPTAVNWYHEDVQITPSTFLTSRNLRERFVTILMVVFCWIVLKGIQFHCPIGLTSYYLRSLVSHTLELFIDLVN